MKYSQIINLNHPFKIIRMGRNLNHDVSHAMNWATMHLNSRKKGLVAANKVDISLPKPLN